MMPEMEFDPVLARIREARHRISERFGHDPKKLVEHYIKLQERHSDRLVRPPTIAPPQDSSRGE
jgi:hypothetical protein